MTINHPPSHARNDDDAADLGFDLDALAPSSVARSSEPPAAILAAARLERAARRTTATACAVPALLALALVFTQIGPQHSTSPAPQLAAEPSVDLPPTTPLAAITLANAEGPITLQTLRLPTPPSSSSADRPRTRTFRVFDRPF